jgi:hypothetical protein
VNAFNRPFVDVAAQLALVNGPTDEGANT